MTISEVKYRQISVNSHGLSKIHVQIVYTCKYINKVYTISKVYLYLYVF